MTLRRLGLFTSVAAILALVFTGLAMPSRAAGVSPDTAAVTVSVSTDEQGSWVAGSELRTTVTVTNASAIPTEAGTVSIALTATPFATRTDLEAWLHPGKDSAPAVGEVAAVAHSPSVPPGSSMTLPPIALPAKAIAEVPKDTVQVRGLIATVHSGNTAAAPALGVVIIHPAAGVPRVKLAMAMPLTAPPSSDGLIPADQLEQLTSAEGTLARQLSGAMNHAVALGIDPRIIASIRALGTSAPASATLWLDELEASSNETFPLQFGDADVSVQAQAGVTKALQPTSLAYALDASNFGPGVDSAGETSAPTSAGEPAGDTATPSPSATPGHQDVRTLEQLLAWPYTLTGVAWPAAGTLTADGLAVLQASGLTTAIISSSNVTWPDRAASPVTALPSGETGLVADAPLSAAIQAAVTATDDAHWASAVADASAQLAIIGQTSRTGAPTVLAALDRMPPSSALQLSRTLSALTTLPWASTVPLGTARLAAPTGGVKVVDAPEPDKRVQLVKRLLDRERSVARFSTALVRPELLTGRQRAQLLALLGTGWLSHDAGWPTAVETNLDQSTKTLSSVQIVVPDNYAFFSSNVNAQITISNALDYPVTVALHASTSNPRLQIGDQVSKTVEGNSHAKVALPIEARRGNGKVTLYLSLTSPKGVSIGDPVSVRVDVHADWEGIAAFALGGIVVLLFAFGIVRNIRRKRRSPSGPEPAAADPGGSNG